MSHGSPSVSNQVLVGLHSYLGAPVIVASLLLHCVQLGDFMDYSMSSFPVLHYLLEFAQIHKH